MSVTIQLRGDAAANWTSDNPVLHQREPGVETDTGKIKIGDGVTAWASLAYFTGSGGVASFDGRTGAVTPQSGDYTAAQVDALPAAGGTVGGALSPTVTALTFASSITVNAALGNVFAVTLTASTGTLATPSNPVDGQSIRIRVIQGGSGSYTLAYSSGWDFGTAGAPTLSTAVGACDYLVGEYNAVKGKWCVSFAGGF